MKKVLIFYASYGGGHLNAAKSIQEYIKATYKTIQTELIDCMKYVNKPIEKITTATYIKMVKKIPWAWGKIYTDSQKGPLAHISSRSNKIFAIKLLKLLREKRPDIIISTHPFGSQMCSYLKRKGKITSKIATIMTDFSPHDQWLVGSDYTDYFFVANDKMKDYLIDKNIHISKIFTTGIPISSRFLEKYDKDKILNRLGLQNNIKTILFFAGGEFGLGKSKTIEIFKSLVNNFNNIQVIAIAGRNLKIKTAFEKIVMNKNSQNVVKILEYTEQVPELMYISDLIISKPGGLAMNLPMIIINPIPGQEEENAQLLENNGSAIWIKKQDSPYNILENILNSPEKLEIMKQKTNILSKKHSTEEICKILLQNNSISL